MIRLTLRDGATLLLLTVLLLLVNAPPAAADDPTTNLVNVANLAGVLALLIGTIIPLVTGLVTDQSWSAGVKFFITALLSAITAFLSQWLQALTDARPFAWQTAVLSALLTLVVAELTYARGWKKSAIGQYAQEHGVGAVGRHRAPD